jgi:manganese transport protein
MDPGNWATDLEGGARFGYSLLWVLVVSNVLALLLQGMCVKLGVATRMDLATHCRVQYSRGLAVTLWLLAEVAIIACDLAELLGSAVALNLLFGVPLVAGALLTTLDVFLIFALQRRGAHVLEAIVLALITTIALCLLVQLVLARPSGSALLSGLVPRLHGGALYLALGMLGATVMPHNLYLQSALVVDRSPRTRANCARLVRKNLLGTGLALNLALLLNGAILVVAAAVFASRHLEVNDLGVAYGLFAPLVGTSVASVLFAVGLLCAGQSATITGTLAGQIVMQGFVRLRLSPALRRAVTRGLAVLPAVAVLAWAGPRATMPLLVGSQVVLSLQLPFAMIPLLRLTNCETVMGSAANGRVLKLCGGVAAVLVIAANAALVARTIGELRPVAPLAATALEVAALAALALLGWISLVPLRGETHAAGARYRLRRCETSSSR